MLTLEPVTSPGNANTEQPPYLPKGFWPVMLTPFQRGGEIDWNGLNALTDFYINAGASGLFACCLSSEMYELDSEERFSLVQHVVDRAAGRVPVVAAGAIGGEQTHEEEIRRVASSGVAAVVLITCLLAGEAETETYWEERVNMICEETGEIPLGLYECPLPFKRLLSEACLRRLALTNRFLFLKDTCCDANRICLRLNAIKDTPLRLYNANVETGLKSLQQGAAGITAVHGNYFPELLVWLCTHPDHECAPMVQQALSELHTSVLRHYPSAAKRALAIRGQPISDFCRKTCDAAWTPERNAAFLKSMDVCSSWVSQLGCRQGN